MLAVWYERQGPADEVLQFGDLPDPEPGPAEVRVRLTRSGVNPGDTKKRGDWLGYGMPFPRIIPHSDGAGLIDAVGAGVDQGRVGRRVGVYGAQSYRPFGTAAQLTVVPANQVVDLPDDVSDDVGACLGIPGITAHRAVFADGPITGITVLVHGVLGAVGTLAAQLARWAGATVIGTVRRHDDLQQVNAAVATHAVALVHVEAEVALHHVVELVVDLLARTTRQGVSDLRDAMTPQPCGCTTMVVMSRVTDRRPCSPASLPRHALGLHRLVADNESGRFGQAHPTDLLRR